MIVRFWGYGRKKLSEFHHPSRAKDFAFSDIPILNRRGAFPEFQILRYPIARLFRSRRVADARGISPVVEMTGMLLGFVRNLFFRRIAIYVSLTLYN